MSARQMIILFFGVAVLLFSGIRFARIFCHSRPNGGLPPGFHATWKCRADGFETNLTPSDISRIFSAGKYRFDSTNISVQLFACPRCGKLELEQTVVQTGPGARK